jgi:hypothetical protein
VIAAIEVPARKPLSLYAPPSKGWSVIISHVQSTSAFVFAFAVAFVVAVAVALT